MSGFLFASRGWPLLRIELLARLGDQRRALRVHVQREPLAGDAFERVSSEEAQQGKIVSELGQDEFGGVRAPFSTEHVNRDHLLVWFASSKRREQHVHVEVR